MRSYTQHRKVCYASLHRRLTGVLRVNIHQFHRIYKLTLTAHVGRHPCSLSNLQ